MKNILRIILFSCIVFCSSVLYADLAFDTGTFTAEWTEATTNEDGTPVTDLLNTSLYYQINNEPKVFIADIPASSPNGGGNKSHQFTVNIPEGNETDLRAVATHTDLSGNVSREAVSLTVRIDKLPPASPAF